MENTIRLRRKNETAIKIVAALSVLRMIVTLCSQQYLASKVWMVIQVVLCVLLVGGCVALYQFMTDSELTKFILTGSFVLVAAISVFNSHDVYNMLPFCVIVVTTLLYLDEQFSLMVAGGATVFMVIKTILLFASKDVSGAGAWLMAIVLFIVMAFCLYVTASNVVREQTTDQQEIQYHLMYQEEVTQNMVHVVENGNEHIELLQSKLDSFHDATEEVARSVDAISQGVTETVSNMESQTDMTSQIQGVIDRLVNVKDHTLESTSDAVTAMEAGGKLVEQLKEKSDAIAVANQSVTEVAEELQDKISSAEEITQIIYQVSSQTNLLALNASIEAARAGEAGRGFSVVADEIRKLADNTKQSIDKITDLLQGVTKLADQTSALVMNSVQASEAQAAYINEVSGSFETIAGAIDTIYGNVKDLDSLSTNLHESNNVIIGSLANQQAASEEIAANAQSSAELSQCNLEDLGDVIGELNQIAEIIGSLSQENADEQGTAQVPETPAFAAPEVPETPAFAATPDMSEEPEAYQPEEEPDSMDAMPAEEPSYEPEEIPDEAMEEPVTEEESEEPEELPDMAADAYEPEEAEAVPEEPEEYAQEAIEEEEPDEAPEDAAASEEYDDAWGEKI